MLKRLLAVVLLATLLPGCSTAPIKPEPLRLRVLSYNIHQGRGADGGIDLQRLASIIKRVEPDLVALQEVDRETKRSEGVDQAAGLGKLTDLQHYFAQAMSFQGGGYGNALLSKAPIGLAYTETLPLSGPPDQEPRVVAIAELAIQDDTLPGIAFCGTHLNHQSSVTRLGQVRAINDEVLLSPNLPTILAGDFNFTPDSKPYRAMITAGWVDTAAAFGDPKPTIPANKPTKRIDYVFVRPASAWRVIDVKVLDEPVASDHAPVLVELEYIQPEP